MITSTEDKLSAIKAINEEKDYIEKVIADMEHFKVVLNSVEITIRSTQKEVTPDLPGEMKQSIIQAILDRYLEPRKKELLDSAVKIMKSDDDEENTGFITRCIVAIDEGFREVDKKAESEDGGVKPLKNGKV